MSGWMRIKSDMMECYVEKNLLLGSYQLWYYCLWVQLIPYVKLLTSCRIGSWCNEKTIFDSDKYIKPTVGWQPHIWGLCWERPNEEKKLFFFFWQKKLTLTKNNVFCWKIALKNDVFDKYFFMLVLLVEYIFLTTFYSLYFNHQLHITTTIFSSS